MNDTPISTRFERLIALADEVFDARNDPGQISMTDDDRARLEALGPDTIVQAADDEGPYAWLLLVPTTRAIMERFTAGEISERQLLTETPVPGTYDAVYLCSALVLEEFRRSGVIMRMACEAVRRMQQVHPISALCCWPFTAAGDIAAHAIARTLGLPLHLRWHGIE